MVCEERDVMTGRSLTLQVGDGDMPDEGVLLLLLLLE